MNEFKLPKVKQWQTGSENFAKHGPLVGHGAPNFAPEASGVVYVDLDAPMVYISAGVTSPSDWLQVS